MITVVYKSSKPRKSQNGAERRYVRKDVTGDGYSYCIKQERSAYDHEQGKCEASDVPLAIRAKADALRGYAFGYVDWPL